MSERVALAMEPRTERGKGAVGRLRKEGWTPCVLYGPGLEENVHGKLETRALQRVLSGRWESLRLSVKTPGGGEEMCIIREAQRDPMTGLPLHVDFLRLVKDRKIDVAVPVETVGRDRSPGVKDGGVLEAMRELQVSALPMDIPDAIQVDVSSLRVGDAIHVKDLALPSGVEALAGPDEIVAVVATSRGVQEAEAGEEPSAADVEVVAKGKAAKEDAEPGE
ncbi:MAG: 50S ribosomal protein L25 [Synergistaceae bacterium]|nr:50S ribosomal protein L25 [Synergistaceae bacterium]